jgi:hypothetical protein
MHIAMQKFRMRADILKEVHLISKIVLHKLTSSWPVGGTYSTCQGKNYLLRTLGQLVRL